MQKLTSLLEYSSLPGVAILVNCRHKIVKLFWFISIVFLLGFSIYFVLEITNNYYKNQEISSDSIITENDSEFPAVSLCVPINDSHVLTNIYNLTEPLMSCSFDGNSCDWTDFELSKKKIKGKSQVCFRFNGGKNALNETTAIRRISSSDIEMGLIVEIDLVKFWSYVDFNTRLIVYIQNASRVFFPFGKSNIGQSIRVAAGENQVRVERVFYSKISNCFDSSKLYNHDSDFVKYFFRTNKTYFQKDCLDLCALVLACNCTEDVVDYTHCLNRQNYDCIFKRNSSLFATSMRPAKCYEKCPYECETVIYKLSQSYLGRYIEKNISKIKLSIYYPELEYVFASQLTKVSWIDLISSVGGVLGLFMGISFFTLIEILAILSEVFGEFISKNKMKLHCQQQVSKIQSKQDSNQNSDTIQDLKSRINHTNQLVSDLNMVIKKENIFFLKIYEYTLTKKFAKKRNLMK